MMECKQQKAIQKGLSYDAAKSFQFPLKCAMQGTYSYTASDGPVLELGAHNTYSLIIR